MRMWLVDPRKMCNQHLLGEHVEMHMFVGSIRKGISMQGYTRAGLVDIALLLKRHNLLVEEMAERGMNHKSPLLRPGETMRTLLQSFSEPYGEVDPRASRAELFRRCAGCRARKKF